MWGMIHGAVVPEDTVVDTIFGPLQLSNRLAGGDVQFTIRVSPVRSEVDIPRVMTLYACPRISSMILLAYAVACCRSRP